MNTTAGNVVRTVGDQLPEVFDTDEILVVQQTNRPALLLEFIRLGVDGFEETIEATRKQLGMGIEIEQVALTSFRGRLENAVRVS